MKNTLKQKEEFVANLSSLLNDYNLYFGTTFDCSEKQLLEEIVKDAPDLWIIFHYLKQLDDTISLVIANGDSIEVIVYLSLARRFIRKAHHYGQPIWWINF